MSFYNSKSQIYYDFFIEKDTQRETIKTFSKKQFDCKTIPRSLFPVFIIFSLNFVYLQKFDGDFRMAVNIRLKYGNFEQDLNKHIDGFECVVLS